MNYKMAAQTIRDTVSTESVVEMYGYKLKHGFMCCPFHGEKEPSLKVYGEGWHCFGCGRGGSVIDFVMEQEGCDFRTAVRALDETFSLGLDRPVNPRENARNVIRQAKADAFVKRFGELKKLAAEDADALIRVILWKLKRAEELRKTAPERMCADNYLTLLTAYEDMQGLEEISAGLDDLEEEVRKWRTQVRQKPRRSA